MRSLCHRRVTSRLAFEVHAGGGKKRESEVGASREARSAAGTTGPWGMCGSPDFPGCSAWVPASLSSGHVISASDFTSLKLDFLFCEIEATVGEVREPSHPELSAQKHSGHLGWSSCRLPAFYSTPITFTLHPEICPLGLPRPHL